MQWTCLPAPSGLAIFALDKLPFHTQSHLFLEVWNAKKNTKVRSDVPFSQNDKNKHDKKCCAVMTLLCQNHLPSCLCCCLWQDSDLPIDGCHWSSAPSPPSSLLMLVAGKFCLANEVPSTVHICRGQWQRPGLPFPTTLDPGCQQFLLFQTYITPTVVARRCNFR